MPAYKRQHFLPAAHLKYFSVDQGACSRDSWVWRFDGRRQRRVPVESQCSSDYHYSKQDPEAAEGMFSQSESRYCACVDKIRAGRRPSELEGGNLLLCMFDFFIRNAIHQNHIGKEEIEAYRMRRVMFWNEVFLQKTAELSRENVQKHISANWGLWVVNAPAGNAFITSDHPSVWTSLGGGRAGLHMLTLPLTPFHTAVAFDKRVVEVISQEMSREDYLTLMGSQMSNAVGSVYSHVEILSDQLEILSGRFAEKRKPDCVTEESNWTLTIAGLPSAHHFSFMRLTPPLL